MISGLNRTAFDLAVYASQGWSPTHHARLASGCWSSSTGRDWLPAGFHLKGFKLPAILLSRASWREVKPCFRFRVPLRVAVWLARRLSSATLRELAPAFGLSHPDSVSTLVRRVDRALAESSKMNQDIEMIERNLDSSKTENRA